MFSEKNAGASGIGSAGELNVVPVKIVCILVCDGHIFLVPKKRGAVDEWRMPSVFLTPREGLKQAIRRCLKDEALEIRVKDFTVLPGENCPFVQPHCFLVPVVVDFEGEPGQDSGEWFDKFPENLSMEQIDVADIIAPRLRGSDKG